MAVIGLGEILYRNAVNEDRIMSNYTTVKEKYKVLKDIAKKAIQEGKCIDISKIPNEGIEYRIETGSENIIFCYYLTEGRTISDYQNNAYDAVITLSKDYRVLNEEYCCDEVGSFEEYRKAYISDRKVLAFGCAMFYVVSGLTLIWFFGFIIKNFIKGKIKDIAEESLSEGKDVIDCFGRRYLLVDKRTGIKYVDTAKNFYIRVMSDSKSDYNWIGSASEIVRVCNSAGFPEKYAIDIKIAILNCFANIEHKTNCGGGRYPDTPEDIEAVYYCYNSLYGIDNKKAIMARKKYLTEMIVAASIDDYSYSGSAFKKLREGWRKAKFEEYIFEEYIDFKKLISELKRDFAEVVRNAKANGEL